MRPGRRGTGGGWWWSVRRDSVSGSGVVVLTLWNHSFRLVGGALPLVEFYFGYPGMGRVLILALGLTYVGPANPARPALVTGLAVTMGIVLLGTGTIVQLLKTRIDPRLRVAEVGGWKSKPCRRCSNRKELQKTSSSHLKVDAAFPGRWLWPVFWPEPWLPSSFTVSSNLLLGRPACLSLARLLPTVNGESHHLVPVPIWLSIRALA